MSKLHTMVNKTKMAPRFKSKRYEAGYTTFSQVMNRNNIFIFLNLAAFLE